MRLALAWLGLQSRWRALVDSSGVSLTDLTPYVMPVVDVGYDAADDDVQDLVEVSRSANAGSRSFVAIAPRADATCWLEAVRITSATGATVTCSMRERDALGAAFSLPETASVRLPAEAGPVEIAEGNTLGFPAGAGWPLDVLVPMRFLIPKGSALYWVTSAANNSLDLFASVRARYA